MSLNTEQYVTLLADELGIPLTEVPRHAEKLVIKLNIGQNALAEDQGVFIKKSSSETVADQREYNMVDDLGISDFLAIKNIFIDTDNEVSKLYHGFDGLDFFANPTGGPVGMGFAYLPGAGRGTLYLEPIPADAWTLDVWHVHEPTQFHLANNTTCDFTDNYTQAIVTRAKKECVPAGSDEWVRLDAAYFSLLSNMEYNEANRKGQ